MLQPLNSNTPTLPLTLLDSKEEHPDLKRKREEEAVQQQFDEKVNPIKKQRTANIDFLSEKNIVHQRFPKIDPFSTITIEVPRPDKTSFLFSLPKHALCSLSGVYKELRAKEGWKEQWNSAMTWVRTNPDGSLYYYHMDAINHVINFILKASRHIEEEDYQTLAQKDFEEVMNCLLDILMLCQFYEIKEFNTECEDFIKFIVNKGSHQQVVDIFHLIFEFRNHSFGGNLDIFKDLPKIWAKAVSEKILIWDFKYDEMLEALLEFDYSALSLNQQICVYVTLETCLVDGLCARDFEDYYDDDIDSVLRNTWKYSSLSSSIQNLEGLIDAEAYGETWTHTFFKMYLRWSRSRKLDALEEDNLVDCPDEFPEDWKKIIEGIISLKSEDLVKAKNDFKEAFKLNSKNGEVIEWLFELYALDGDEETLKYLESCINSHPRKDVFLERKASIYKNLGQFDVAIQELNLLLQIKPKDFDALKLRGICQHKKNNYQEAYQDLNTAYQLLVLGIGKYHEETELSDILSYCCIKLEKWNEAIKYLNGYLVHYQNRHSYQHLFSRARCYFKLGKFNSALPDLELANRLKPNDKSILNAIATVKEAQTKASFL